MHEQDQIAQELQELKVGLDALSAKVGALIFIQARNEICSARSAEAFEALGEEEDTLAASSWKSRSSRWSRNSPATVTTWPGWSALPACFSLTSASLMKTCCLR